MQTNTIYSMAPGGPIYIPEYKSKDDFLEKADLKGIAIASKFFDIVTFHKAHVDGITPMNFTDPQQNQFAINMLKAFEEFDQNLNPPGLITKQFEAIAQKCKDKGVQILIGEKIGNSNVSFDIQGKYNDFYLFVNLSETVVKEQMEKPIYIIQQKNKEIPEIKAIPLRELVGQRETDENKLIAKCAAYLLFHELFHVNTFLNDNEIMDRQYPSEMQEVIKNLFGNDTKYYDDARNTIFTANQDRECPGEFELLRALYPDKPSMRLYFGKGLNFYDKDIRDNCLNIFDKIFKSELSEKELSPTKQQKLNYHIISNMILPQDIEGRIKIIKTFFQDNSTQLLPEQMHHKISQMESNLYKLNEDLRKQIFQDEALNEALIEDIIDNATKNLEYLKEEANLINIFEGVNAKSLYFFKLDNLVKFERKILETKLNNIECQLQQLNALKTFQTQSNENLEITANESILKPFEDYSFAFKELQSENRNLEQIKV